MSIKQAIEALESCDPGDYSTGHVIHPSYDEEKVNAALAALRSMPESVQVPKRPTQAMRDVMDSEGWAWEDLLAAAEAITEDEHAILATPHTEAVRMSEAWISVDERLPGEQGCDSEDVMLFINGHCEITDMECRQGGAWGLRLGYFDAEKQAFRVHGRPESFVTHWQPLPPPPVEQATAARLGVKMGDV